MTNWLAYTANSLEVSRSHIAIKARRRSSNDGLAHHRLGSRSGSGARTSKLSRSRAANRIADWRATRRDKVDGVHPKTAGNLEARVEAKPAIHELQCVQHRALNIGSSVWSLCFNREPALFRRNNGWNLRQRESLFGLAAPTLQPIAVNGGREVHQPARGV